MNIEKKNKPKDTINRLCVVVFLKVQCPETIHLYSESQCMYPIQSK